MNKAQAYQSFWESFGLKAYDENTLPTGQDAEKKMPKLPYITYEYQEDNFDQTLLVQASVWYKDASGWKKISDKGEEIAQAIGMGGKMVTYDGGAFWIRRSNPFMTRMVDESDSAVKRLLFNVEVEFISAI